MAALFLADNTPSEITDAIRADDVLADVEIVRLRAGCGMPAPVASHPDMLLYSGFGSVFVRSAHKYVADEVERATRRRVVITSDPPADSYPADAAFDCVMIGGALVGRADAISPAVKRAASAAMTPVLNVAQGYAKCSVCTLGDGARAPILTADPSIHKLALSRGVRSVLIGSGSISLPGYSTGFIGGASFYARGIVYFLGNIELHPDHDAVMRAAADAGVHVRSMSRHGLFDAGAIYMEE